MAVWYFAARLIHMTSRLLTIVPRAGLLLLLGCPSANPEEPTSTGASAQTGTSTSANATTGEQGSATTPTSEGSADLPGDTTATSTVMTSDGSTSADLSTTGAGDTEPDQADFPLEMWIPGPAAEVVPGPDLRPLPGGLAGPPIYSSNNPEPFTGDGWLMQSARKDPARGGGPTPLMEGVLYLFHINHAGAKRTLHILATNPNPATVGLAVRGSLYNNVEEPLLGAGTGQSHAVARDWELGTLRSEQEALQIAPAKAIELFRSELAPGNMVDGRFEFSADAGIYLYTVITSSGLLTDAINLSQGPGASGVLAKPGPNAYGRDAGVYSHSRWEAAPTLEIPAAPAHLGLMLNTSDKFAFEGATLQDQTAPAVMHLDDSSERSHGNYGHRFVLDFSLCNPGATTRSVRLRFVSHKTGAVDEPSQTWNGPVRVDGVVQDVSTRPTAPSHEMGVYMVEADGCRVVPVELYVPGLITAGQQLVFESI
jgi:hypothetical protein